MQNTAWLKLDLLCLLKNNLPKDKNTLAHETQETIEKLVREQWGKLLACLIAHLGDFQLSEDALQDALESALVHWQRNGLPRSPVAWLLQTARRKAIDRIRRANNFKSKQKQYQHLLELESEDILSEESYEIDDERLRLIFTCCHPALDKKSQIALTLKTLGGLKTEEIARAFLVSKETMAQRLVRVKRKIKHAGIPFSIPNKGQIEERMEAVLWVIYLIFNEGYFSSHGLSQIRVDLSNEALRLIKILDKLKPREPEIEGLLALIYLHISRNDARQTLNGEMIKLEFQNRDLWDRKLIEQGINILNIALRRSKTGSYQIQAAISAIHSEAKTHESTGWQEIILLYEELYKLQANPVILLNKAVAISYLQGAEKALPMLENLEPSLKDYQPFYVTYADLLRRDGQVNLAKETYLKAIKMSDEQSTKSFLEKQLENMLLDSL